MMRRIVPAALMLLVGLATPLAAQADRLRQQQDELQRVRRERAALEQRMLQLRTSAHDISEEMTNLQRQAAATARVVRTLETQLLLITEEVGSTTANLVRAQDELTMKRAVLRRRVADIYKRGALFSVEVLLSARSIGELVARYKYLHLLTLRDRALVRRVEQLQNSIARQHGTLVRLRTDIEINRREKEQEETRLKTLTEQRAQSLVAVRRETQRAQARLAQMTRDEQRLSGVIASIESARTRAERERADRARRAGVSPARPAPSTLSAAGTRRVDWPVQGDIIYRFGRVVNENNTTTRWNGIGISAPAGSAVRAIAAGEVVVAESFGTYGLTVILQHPGGDYTVYGSLARIDVRKGQRVTKSQSLGTVGSTDRELPPHLHFEMRPGGRAVDPLDFLR